MYNRVYMTTVFKSIRNYTTGRQGFKPEAIVIHIAEGYLAGAHSWFNNPDSQASSHYMVGRSGEVWQFVQEVDTAWHAGGVANPSWGLLKPNINPNSYTIGIEHEGFTGEGWTEAMYQSSGQLIGEACRRWGIPLDRNHVIGHHQINSLSRNNCPGAGVNWDKLLSIASNFYEDPAMIAELQAQIRNLQAAQNDITTRNTQLVTENNKLRQQISDLQNSLPQAGEIVQLRDQVKTLNGQVQNLTKEVYDLQQTRTKLKRDLDDALAKLQAGRPDLASYSTSELASAAFGRILGR